jgi:hypothetical protein
MIAALGYLACALFDSRYTVVVVIPLPVSLTRKASPC